MTDYLPHFIDNKENRWELLQVNICIDFGGRQAQCEFQRNNDDGKFPTKTFVYYYNTDEFTQCSQDECQSVTTDDLTGFNGSCMHKVLKTMFSQFGEPFKG